MAAVAVRMDTPSLPMLPPHCFHLYTRPSKDPNQLPAALQSRHCARPAPVHLVAAAIAGSIQGPAGGSRKGALAGSNSL